MSVLADGSTDTGIIEQEIAYIRTVKDDGELLTKMVQCGAVKNGHAAGVLEAIDEAVGVVGINQQT